MYTDDLEHQDARAEDWAFDNVEGDLFRCPQCGRWTPLKSGHPQGPGPYALPVCWRCV